MHRRRIDLSNDVMNSVCNVRANRRVNTEPIFSSQGELSRSYEDDSNSGLSHEFLCPVQELKGLIDKICNWYWTV